MISKEKDLKTVVIIPARYGSSRFPGKPLAMLGGKPLIARVLNQVKKAGFQTIVATDDLRIADCVEAHHGTVVMTDSDLPSGTDRVWKALQKVNCEVDVVINVQGDEPFIQPEQIRLLAECFRRDPDCRIATLVRRFNPEAGFEALFDPNVVKVVFDNDMKALYFSRSIIPYLRGTEWKEWLDKTDFYTHVGIYAYRASVLGELTSMPRSSLEIAESLEQLRWLQEGYKINVAITDAPTIGIDTPDDLAAAETYLRKLEEIEDRTENPCGE